MQPNEGRYSEQNQRSPFTPLNINFKDNNTVNPFSNMGNLISYNMNNNLNNINNNMNNINNNNIYGNNMNNNTNNNINNNNIGFNLNPNNINNPQYFNINRENNPFGNPNPNINQNNTIIMNQNIPNYNFINNGISQINQINNSINNINYRIIKCGNKFSNSDINDIIITCNQGYKGREDPLSKWIIQRIKAILGGDWVVFICAIGLKGYDLSVSLDDENRFISFIIDNFKFQIIKIKD